MMTASSQGPCDSIRGLSIGPHDGQVGSAGGSMFPGAAPSSFQVEENTHILTVSPLVQNNSKAGLT